MSETTITYRMPNPAEAEKVIEEIEAPARRQGAGFANANGDVDSLLLGGLLQPVYLEPLLRRLKSGDQWAWRGIGSIATPEATASLIKLASESDGKMAIEAETVFKLRLPHGYFGYLAEKEHKLLVSKSWDEKLAPSVLILATQWLPRDDPEFIAAAGEMLQCVGEPADAPAIFSALDRVLEPMVIPRKVPSDNFPDYPKPVAQLAGAIRGLRARGFSLDESGLHGDGQAFVYFASFFPSWPPRPPTRSQRWRTLLDTYSHSPCVVIREAAILSIPYPAPIDCASVIKAAMTDPDASVRRAALMRNH